ncbi:MAG: class I SAM-dependent methyltransferase [Longimicrobiales bacterium]
MAPSWPRSDIVIDNWWQSYFGEDFFQLHHDLFPEEQSRGEVSAIIELLGLPVGSRILDVPCGWGRHSHLLAEAGYDVVGADLSLPLLRHARARPAGRQLYGWIMCDIRSLPLPRASVDGVINVFTSLGLFQHDADHIAALAELRRVLRPGAPLLLESMHRDEVISAYAERDHWTLPDGTEVRVRRRFDPVGGISYERLRWRRGAQHGEKRHALRLRTATEVDLLLARAGFTTVRYCGDWDGAPLTQRSPHLIALASAC